MKVGQSIQFAGKRNPQNLIERTLDMSKRAHAGEIAKWASDKDSVVFCRSFDPTGESEWIAVPDPHWSPEVQYKTILPEYAEAWKAWLDGELEVLSHKEEWVLFAELPSFANSPEFYRRIPKDPECSTYPNHPTELSDLRTELAELKTQHKLALEGWEREKNERIRLEEIAAEFDEQSKTNDHLSAMLKACKEEIERPAARSVDFDCSHSVADGLRKLLAERDEILKERDSELVEANARAEHWKRLAVEKAVNPPRTCMHDLVKILYVLRDRGTDMVVTVTSSEKECRGLTYDTYNVVGVAEDLWSLYESARSEVNRLAEEKKTLTEQDAKLEQEQDLLRLLHVWFLKKAPEHYKGCGLYFDVIAALSSN